MPTKNTGLISLFTILAFFPGAAGHARLQLFCQTSTILELPLQLPALVMPEISVVPIRLESPAKLICRGVRYFSCNCMMSIFPDPRSENEIRETVDAMGRAYLKCQAIIAYRLAPDIPVEHYPDDHFGSWVRHGFLIVERSEFTDEPEMRRIFLLLVEAIDGYDDEYDFVILATEPKMTVAEYRKEIGFRPELSFEFAGDVSVRVDISTKLKRMIVQTGEEWTSFALDRWSAEALQEFVPARL